MALYFQGGVAEAELLRLLKERDELKAALLEFEKHMEEIQRDVKALSAERDHYKALFKKVNFKSKVYLCIYLKMHTLGFYRPNILVHSG